MADHDQGAGELLQGVEQHLARLDVQVVGGFVEDEEIERPGQQHGQHHPAFFAAAEDFHLLVDIIALEEEGGAEVADHADIGLGHGRLHGCGHRHLTVEQVHGMLAEIADLDVGADGHRAGGRLGLPGQHLEQGGLAGPVAAGEGDFFLPSNHARKAIEHLAGGVVGLQPDFAKAIEPANVVTAAGRLGKLEPHHPLLRRQLDPLDLLQLLDARLHLGGMGNPRPEAGDEVLLLGQHLLLAPVTGQQLFPADLPLAQVKIIVAAVGGHALVGHLDNPPDHAVHELAVMAGHEQRALELAHQPLLQPDNGFHVQMVGRLVQQQDVRVDGEDAGQGDAHLPAAAEGLHRKMPAVAADAQPGQHRLGPVLQVIAAPVLELLGGVAVAFQEGLEFVVRHGRGHGRFHLPDLLAQGGDLAGGGHDLGQGRSAGHLAHLLGKIADHRASGAGNLALVRLLLPGDQAENGRLAGAVGTDQAGAGGRENLHGGVVEQHPGAVLLADVGQMDHGNSQEKRRMEPGRDLGRCRKGRNRAGKGGVHTPRSGRSHPCRDFCGEQAGG